jgi:putative ABC transport system substrate-binding protein
MPVIGFLDFTQTKDRLAAFNRGLSGLGYVDGKNVVIDHRSVFGQYDRLPAMAADLVQSRVALMFATGTPG